MTRDNSECLIAALRYASRGWPVFPVKENKAPYTQRGSRDATTDEATICEWWKRWPSALVSIVTGERSRA